MYEDLGRPKKVNFIELGPGRGTLARQILTALPRMPGGSEALQAMNVRLVEVSTPLRRTQFDALKCTDPVLVSEVLFTITALATGPP
jgi:NADH dehydrogenase [ubiquinone] 1 alpha subcomplex assembly factor 7